MKTVTRLIALLLFIATVQAQNPIERQIYCADAGSTDAYSCTPSVAITSYLTGRQLYTIKVPTANTGAATVTFFGAGGIKTIKKVAGGVTTDLDTNDIRAGQIVVMKYDGINMQMLSQLGNAASGGGAWGGITGTLNSQTDLQAALDAKCALAGCTMIGALAVVLEAYDATGWNGDTGAPQKDAVRDQVETMLTSIAAKLPLAGGTLTGSHDFSSAFLRLPLNNTLTAGDCDDASEYGRIQVDGNATSGARLYVCESGGWVLQGAASGVTSVIGLTGVITMDTCFGTSSNEITFVPGCLTGYFSLSANGQNITGVNTTISSSASEAAFELVAAGIPSSLNAGGIGVYTGGTLYHGNGTNVLFHPAIAGSGVTPPTEPTAGGCVFWAAVYTVVQDVDCRWSGSTLTLGTAGSTAGAVKYENATSGSITVSPPTGALGTIARTLQAFSGIETIQSAALTATRVPFAGANGILTDDADCTFATDTLSCTKVVAATSVSVAGAFVTNNIVQNSQSAAYTVVLGDAGKQILHPTADNNARTFTIDSNANVAYPVGTCLTFVNQINTVTIAITSDTLTLAGAGTTGSRTLAAAGWATACKVATTAWFISGSGLT